MNRLKLFFLRLITNKKIMNKLALLAVACLMLVTASAKNYNAPERAASVKQQYTDTITGDTYTIKNKEGKSLTYEVYKSKSGAFYIWKNRKDSSGKVKTYLPKSVQQQMGREYKK